MVHLGRKAGMVVRDLHGIRHAAITEALDLTGGNVRSVQRVPLDIATLQTLIVYDDSVRTSQERSRI